ncbi:MAG: 1-(5-phosphoribosyl)-5-[(5-phosphoribosylamino)methylideneamino]imidazole-4-carboxamide isomerase [Oscillospiraceae bacterium]|nr:1-(5-phosphoribosyl)-5-[(5-phosphoribosylamino)methylideneamino]imidazole-4-carboxamide isomerase [Oscillospiraceae bacterium]
MIILPAIDILGGECVRLLKGEYGTAHRVAMDIFSAADNFVSRGAEYIHMVDLDGAKSGKPENNAVIIETARRNNVPVEVGGGIRDFDSVRLYAESDVNIKRIILGSAALTNPEFVKRAAGIYGDRIAVGIDAKDGYVKINGWAKESTTDYITLARLMEQAGVGNIIYTDINRDGTLLGPDLNGLKALSEAVKIKITASGGIRDISDILELKKLGLYGAICGKSLYSGTLSLEEAIAMSK